MTLELWNIIAVVLLWLLVFGGIGAALGNTKGLPVLGVICSLLLGPIGWITVLLMQPTADAVVKRERELEAARRRHRDC